MDVRILGPLEVVTSDGPVRLGGPRQRATLAILVLGAGRVVPVERLADDLYAGEPPLTAVTQVQRQISELRKAVGPGLEIETRAPGYVLRLAPGELDLQRFERLLAEGSSALARGDPAHAADALRSALGLWRGPALADLSDEPFAQRAIARLEELRLLAVERRIAAELQLGRHAELVPELEELVVAEPLREELAAQLMLALYRSGRQADALAAFRSTRRRLADDFGLEPTPALRQVEASILRHDPSLGAGLRDDDGRGAVVVTAADEGRETDLLALARSGLDRSGELVFACLVSTAEELEPASRRAEAHRSVLGAGGRAAAFTTLDWAADVVGLATACGAALVVLDAPASLGPGVLPAPLAAVLERSPSDVALLAGGAPEHGRGDGVFVPFAGGEHDWAALELAAAIASASELPLRLVGTGSTRGGGDASRMLADASLAVQRAVGISASPLLAPASPDALLAVVESAALVVSGVGSGWRTGLGDVRAALVANAPPPVLLVHRGPRPGLLAPGESRTQFTWSLQS